MCIYASNAFWFVSIGYLNGCHRIIYAIDFSFSNRTHARLADSSKSVAWSVSLLGESTVYNRRSHEPHAFHLQYARGAVYGRSDLARTGWRTETRRRWWAQVERADSGDVEAWRAHGGVRGGTRLATRRVEWHQRDRRRLRANSRIRARRHRRIRTGDGSANRQTHRRRAARAARQSWRALTLCPRGSLARRSNHQHVRRNVPQGSRGARLHRSHRLHANRC